MAAAERKERKPQPIARRLFTVATTAKDGTIRYSGATITIDDVIKIIDDPYPWKTRAEAEGQIRLWASAAVAGSVFATRSTAIISQGVCCS